MENISKLLYLPNSADRYFLSTPISPGRFIFTLPGIPDDHFEASWQTVVRGPRETDK